jgi:YVTN family beta-propeller protein
MQFGILGPVEAWRDGRRVPLGGPKPRALVAMLLLARDDVLSRDRLIDGIWGGRPPPSAAHTLDDHVSRLRKALGADRIETLAPGYRLRVEDGELDLDRFEQHLRAGREALAAGDGAAALARLDEALALWRGPALADVLAEPVGQEHAERLEERRLLAIEERTDAAIILRRDADLIAPLEALVAEHPFRERLLGQLALVLYRAGRQAEALAALDAGRRRLGMELGLEPGPELQLLQQRILQHDPALGRAPAAARPIPQDGLRRRRRLTVRGALAVCVLLVAAVTGWALLRGPPAVTADAAAGHLIGLRSGPNPDGPRVTLNRAPAAMAANGRTLWLADPTAGTVSRVDLETRAVNQRIAVDGTPGVLAMAGGALWVSGVPGTTLTRIDPGTATVTQTVGLGGVTASALASGGAGGLWIADAADDKLVRIDTATGRVDRTIAVDVHPTAMAIGAGAIWVADYHAHAVAEIDLRSGRTLATIAVGNGPVALAVTPSAVWVANALDSTVSRIDPARGAVVATIAVGSGPADLAVARGAVWVAGRYPGTLTEIDADRDAVVRTRRVDGVPTTMAAVAGRLWLGVRPRTEPRGGTLVLLRTNPFTVDPVVPAGAPDFQASSLTSDGLVAINHAAGAEGLQLVPDLALSLPTPTDAGRIYTFRLRPGIRYSDGRPVRASDFRRAIERAFVLRALTRDVLSGIVGTGSCAVTCDLRRGVVADDRGRTVTFRLAAADSDFLLKLAKVGLAIPAPPGTPMRRLTSRAIPGTGPYMVAAADAHHVRYVRNPRFHEWSHAAQPAGNPDEIVWRFGLSPADEVRAVAQGRADWSADPVPGSMLPGLRVRFPSRLHSYPTTDTEWLQFNTTLPPFDDLRVRRAVNLALDRRAVVGIWGGPEAATVTCQLLPPGVPGHRRYCPYTRDPTAHGAWTAPDLAGARRLVAASGTRGMRLHVWGFSDDAFSPGNMLRHTISVLRRLGYRPQLHLVTHAALSDAPEKTYDAIHLFPTGWTDNTAESFFDTWISCHGAGNHGWFCVPSLDRAMRRARSLVTGHPAAAARLYGRIDREVVDHAALVPLVNPRVVDFFSTRVHNVQRHAYLGPIADQIVLR